MREDFNEWVKDPDGHDDEARKYCRDQAGILTLVVNSVEKRSLTYFKNCMMSQINILIM